MMIGPLVVCLEEPDEMRLEVAAVSVEAIDPLARRSMLLMDALDP